MWCADGRRGSFASNSSAKLVADEDDKGFIDGVSGAGMRNVVREHTPHVAYACVHTDEDDDNKSIMAEYNAVWAARGGGGAERDFRVCLRAGEAKI